MGGWLWKYVKAYSCSSHKAECLSRTSLLPGGFLESWWPLVHVGSWKQVDQTSVKECSTNSQKVNDLATKSKVDQVKKKKFFFWPPFIWATSTRCHLHFSWSSWLQIIWSGKFLTRLSSCLPRQSDSQDKPFQACPLSTWHPKTLLFVILNFRTQPNLIFSPMHSCKAGLVWKKKRLKQINMLTYRPMVTQWDDKLLTSSRTKAWPYVQLTCQYTSKMGPGHASASIILWAINSLFCV